MTDTDPAAPGPLLRAIRDIGQRLDALERAIRALADRVTGLERRDAAQDRERAADSAVSEEALTKAESLEERLAGIEASAEAARRAAVRHPWWAAVLLGLIAMPEHMADRLGRAVLWVCAALAGALCALWGLISARLGG